MFRYWLNQNNSRIQLINLASLIFLDFDVTFMRLQTLGTKVETLCGDYCFIITVQSG